MSWKNFLSLFTVTLFFLFPTLSNAANDDVWNNYVEDCRRLNNEINTVEKQIKENRTSIFINSIKFRLKHIENYRKRVALKPNDKKVFKECEGKIKNGVALLNRAMKYQADLEKARNDEAKRKHQNSPEMKKARSLGYDDFQYIDAIKDVFDKGGLKRLKKTLFLISEYSGHFRISQKVDNYNIYTIEHKFYKKFVQSPMIAIKPVKGEFIQRGNYIPGKYYKFLELAKFKKLDGFPVTLPVLKRIMSEQEMVGYGQPPNDEECRKLIIGSWSEGWYKDWESIYIIISNYKADGTYEEIKYIKALSSNTWKKELGVGNWKLKDQVLQISEERSGSWEKETNIEDWRNFKPTTESSSSRMSSLIIKLVNNTLIITRGKEEKYLRLKNSKLSEARRVFRLD